ncbi:MAG: YkvA family protein [Armatimonadota bacterium]
MTWFDSWKQQVRHLKREAYALYLACKDPRVPWYARVLTACVVGYAFSPIDLIPDFIPILGYLDDLILIPLGIAAVLRMIPPVVMEECRGRAEEMITAGKPVSRVAGAVIILIWLVSAVLLSSYLLRRYEDGRLGRSAGRRASTPAARKHRQHGNSGIKPL